MTFTTSIINVLANLARTQAMPTARRKLPPPPIKPRRRSKRLSMSNSPDNSSPPPVSGHVDQIRDIIFGGQMRDYEQRFKKLEERLTQQAAELSEDLQKRAEALAELGIKGFESLTVNLKAEKGERAEADKELTKELKELSKTIDR